MTLMETVVVAVLGVILTLAMVSFGVFLSKLNKSTLSQLRFSIFSKKAIEEIAKVIRYAKRIEVTNEGTRLLCTDENNITSAIYYHDDDGRAWTLANNRLYYVADIHATSPQPVAIAGYISPLPDKPIFTYVDRTSAVEISFRMGDPRNEPKAPYHRETGPGPQGLDIRTAFGPRNSYLEY